MEDDEVEEGEDVKGAPLMSVRWKGEEVGPTGK